MRFCSPTFSRRVGVRTATFLALLALLALLGSSGARAATPGTFTTLASSPSPVNNVAVDPATNIIYAQEFDGQGFYSYNPATNTWATLPSAPINQEDNGGAAYLNGKIYTAYSENDTQMGVYDIATKTWTTMGFPPGTGSGDGTGDITAFGGRLYLAAGTEFVSYDPATNVTETLASAPAFSDATYEFQEEDGNDCAGTGFTPWGALAVYKGQIYGTQGDGCSGSAVYDIASNKWTELPLVPGFTVLGGAVDPVSGTFFAYGGYEENGFFSLNTAKRTWSTLTFPSTDINDGGMAYIPTLGRQGIYATYGEDSTGFTRFNTVGGAAVSVKNSASAKHPSDGQTFTYTVRVQNKGGSSASKVVIRDTLSSKVDVDSVKASKGKCAGKHTVKCKLGTLKEGHSVKVKIKVTAAKTGKAKSTAKLTTPSFNVSSKIKSSVTVKIS